VRRGPRPDRRHDRSLCCFSFYPTRISARLGRAIVPSPAIRRFATALRGKIREYGWRDTVWSAQVRRDQTTPRLEPISGGHPCRQNDRVRASRQRAAAWKSRREYDEGLAGCGKLPANRRAATDAAVFHQYVIRQRGRAIHCASHPPRRGDRTGIHYPGAVHPAARPIAKASPRAGGGLGENPNTGCRARDSQPARCTRNLA
jgi:hypothetical protein